MLATLRRHSWLAITAFLIPFSGAAVLVMALPNLYRATATVLVQRDLESASSNPAAQPSDVETRLQTIRERVLSRERLDALVEKFGLYPELRRRAPREAIIDRMRKDIQIQLKGSEQGAAPAGTIAFSLGFRGVDRVLTAAVANSLAQSYVEENSRIRGLQTRGTAETLEAQVTEMRARLDEQESRIGAYQDTHNGELPQQLGVNLARIQQLEMQLQLNHERRLRAQDRRDIAGAQPADPLHADKSGNSEAEASRMARLKQDLAELRTSYSDKYPEVMRLKAEISTLETRQWNAPSEAPARRPQAAQTPQIDDLGNLGTEEDRLAREINLYRARVDRAPQREQEFAQLSRDYSTTKELYGTLLKRYQEARITDDLERGVSGGQLRILDTAIAPPSAYAPDRRRLLLFAFMAALALAAGAVVMAERSDTSLHTVDDLRSFTRVPVLVSIPPLKTHATQWKNRRKLAWLALATAAGVILAGAVTWSVASGNIDLVQLLARGSAS